MISRTAEHCFWLYRNMERVESIANVLQVNRTYVLDVNPPPQESWLPLIIVMGEEERFEETHGLSACGRGDVVEAFLTWQEEGVASIFTALKQARENARVIRDTLSLEMWEAINRFWLWLKSERGRQSFKHNRDRFYHRIKESCQIFHGLYHSSILQEEPFAFMRLGLLLERVNITARLIDVKYHRKKLEHNPSREYALESVRGYNLLRFCGASEAFFKRCGGEINRAQVAEFLIFEDAFPHAIRYCLSRAMECLADTFPEGGPVVECKSVKILAALLASVKNTSIDGVTERGLHEELIRIVDTVTTLCEAIHNDFFQPTMMFIEDFCKG